jgi:NADH-quinone oxidoreductase subunit L
MVADAAVSAGVVAGGLVVAVTGWQRLDPAIGIAIAALGHLGRRSDGPQMERFLGPFETLFANRFYIDQIYEGLVVRPLEILAFVAAAFDRHLIDGLVDGIGRLPGAVGGWARQLQGGLLQRYALAGVLGTVLIVLALARQLL